MPIRVILVIAFHTVCIAKPYVTLRCFKDEGDLALPDMEGKDSQKHAGLG